ncbi:MAG: tetratricopeptide repeat protein, partial [Acidobacteriota bacterium]
MKYRYLTLISIIAVSIATVRAQSDGKTLEPRSAIRGEIASGEIHSYQVQVSSDQFLRVIVDQISVDVAVRVYRPGREQPDNIDLAVGVSQPEEIFLITGTPGVCRFEIRTSKDKTRGAYQIKLEELRAATPRDRSILEGLRGLVEAQQLFRQGGAENLRKAAEKFQELAALFRSLQHPSGEADALLFLGLSHRRMGDNQKAMELYTRALPLYRQTGQRQRQSAILSNLASIYDSRGQADLARDHFKQSLAIAVEIRDTVSQAIVLNNLSVICQSLGRYQDALSYLRQSLPLRRANGDRAGECRTLNNFASVYSNLGDYQTALRYLTDALKIAQEEKNLDLEATTLNNYAVIHRSFGNHREAKTYLEQALPKMRAFNNPRMEAVALNNLGSVYLQLGETQRALEHLEQALKLMRNVEERHREAGTLNNLGRAYTELQQYDRAMDFFSQALELRRGIRDQVGQADSLHAIALLERKRGNLSLAQARSEEAIRIIESLRASVESADLRTSYFASKRDYYDLYIDTLMRLHKQSPSAGHDRAALETSERARARGLIDSLVESRANLRQGVDATLLERERSLQQSINSKESYRLRFLSNRATQTQARELEEELTRLMAELSEVREQIRIKSPRYASLTQPAALGLSDIQRLLDRDTLLLEYSLGKESSYLWAVTDSSIASFTLPSRDEIEAAARRVYELATARNHRPQGETVEARRARIAQSDAEYPKAATALSRLLLDPAASQMSKKRLVIVAEGALQYVPFAALPAPKSLESGVTSLKSGKGRNKDSRLQTPDSRLALISNYEIINLPSVSALAALRQYEGRTARSALAVFADPVFTSDDPRIRRSADQAQST